MKARQLNSNDEFVLDTLGRAHRPLSAYAILDQAPSGGRKAPVQVYRSLQKLEQRGLVHRIEALNAFIACSEIAHSHHKPGFVICRDCGTVREFEDERMARIAEEAAGEAFAIDVVSLEIFGQCGPCQAPASATV